MPPGLGRFEVGVVGRLDLGRPLEQQVGGGEQGARSWPTVEAVASSRLAALARSPSSTTLVMGPGYLLTARSSRGVFGCDRPRPHPLWHSAMSV